MVYFLDVLDRRLILFLKCWLRSDGKMYKYRCLGGCKYIMEI